MKVVEVGAAIFLYREDGSILMGKRKGSHGPGTWALPGGHVEFGEEPEDSVRRELKEETGLEVGEILPFFPTPYANAHFPACGRQAITLFFYAQIGDGKPRTVEPDKCEGWEWFQPDNLPEPLFGSLAGSQLLLALREQHVLSRRLAEKVRGLR